MEIFLGETFGSEAFPSPPSVNGAHRVGNSRMKQVGPPRPFIARIHRYQDKERILKLAREAGSLSFRGSEIHFYPDYSAEVSKKRAAYSQLRNAGFGYRMFFPAKLQVTDKNGQKSLFSSPEAVSAFLQNNRPGTSTSWSIDFDGVKTSLKREQPSCCWWALCFCYPALCKTVVGCVASCWTALQTL